LRPLATATILGGALGALLLTVPNWTARIAEAQREAAFESRVRSAIPADLPLCPLPGPQRDAFLDKSAAALKNSRDLWIPVCRIAPLPGKRIVIVAKTRAELSDCMDATVYRPDNVICALDEPLDLLGDSKATHTWARRESGEVIWTTSRSLAWQDHLVFEHRQWMMLAFLLLGAATALVFGAWRLHGAFALRAACHGPGEPDLPRHSELLLHWVLGRNANALPGDLGEEYLSKLEDGLTRKQADLWYRQQVFYSIAPVAARLVETALTHPIWRMFVRRG